MHKFKISIPTSPALNVSIAAGTQGYSGYSGYSGVVPNLSSYLKVDGTSTTTSAIPFSSGIILKDSNNVQWLIRIDTLGLLTITKILVGKPIGLLLSLTYAI